MVAISPTHRYGEITENSPIEDKIEYFRSRVLGWQLNIGEELAKQQKPENGFAILMLVASYFEMIGLNLLGVTSDENKRSCECFIEGFKNVFPNAITHPHSIDNEEKFKQYIHENEDKIYKIFYEYLRCGLYHQGMVKSGLVIDYGYKYAVAMGVDPDGHVLMEINPILFTDRIISHFNSYILSLGDLVNINRQKNFLLRLNYESKYEFGKLDKFEDDC